MSKFERFGHGQVVGFLHRPEQDAGRSLVLTHGAGSNCEAPLLLALAQEFQTLGYHVLRYDLPFRQAGRSGPPHPSKAAEDREGLREAIEAMRHLFAGSIRLGGHSYGGRQATMLAAEHPGLVDRLLLLSYPLHPPNRPDQLRTAHFPDLRTPAVFVHGDNDPFGTVTEMETALTHISAAHRLCVIEKAGHDLKRGKFDLLSRVISPFNELAEVSPTS